MNKILFATMTLLYSSQALATTIDSIGGQYFTRIEVEAGVNVPLGALKQTANLSPNVGLWYRTPFSENSVYSIGGSVYFPRSTNIQYLKDDFQSETKSFAGVLGLKLDKTILTSTSGKSSLVWSSILGYGFYFFDDVRARAEYDTWSQSKKDKNDKPTFVKPFNTVHLAQGLLFQYRGYGIHFRYNYAPYHIFTDIIDKKFGSQSLTIGLFYRQ